MEIVPARKESWVEVPKELLGECRLKGVTGSGQESVAQEPRPVKVASERANALGLLEFT